MQHRWFTTLAMLVASAPANVHATALRGRVDHLDATRATGWACVADGSAPASIEVYAGDALLGIYPTDQARGGANCTGAGTHGFAIRFTTAGRAMFAGRDALKLFAVAPGLPPRLLPAGKQARNPLPLPNGALHGMNAHGRIDGSIDDKVGAPLVRLFAGGPPGVGTAGKPARAKLKQGSHYAFSLPLPHDEGAPGPGMVLPVFGTVADTHGVGIPLNGVVALNPVEGGAPQPGTAVPIDARVAQQGTVSGIRNTLFTNWLPAGSGFAAVTGNLSLTGSDASFSEALVELATTGDSQAVCAAENGATPANPPALSRLWAGILKTNATRPVGVPINVALPHAVPGAAAGTCLMAWVSAGYPYLTQGIARYTTTEGRLDVTAIPTPSGSASVVPFGIGGEFRFPAGATAPQSVYVGLQATVPLAVDFLAGSASAAPVAGAPPGSGWTPLPTGGWAVATSFYYLPQAVCAAANFNTQKSNGLFSVLRDATPATLAVPPGAVSVMSMPIFSIDTQAVQQVATRAFPPHARRGFSGALAAGDCLIAYETVSTAPGGTSGVLDVENQSTVFLRVVS